VLIKEAIGSGEQSSSRVGVALELVPPVIIADELWKVARLGGIMRLFIKRPRKIQMYHDRDSLSHKRDFCDWRCAFQFGDLCESARREGTFGWERNISGFKPANGLKRDFKISELHYVTELRTSEVRNS